MCKRLHTFIPCLKSHRLIASALCHKLCNVSHKLLVGSQLFQAEMHAIAPVMLWIGRNVDALGFSIRQTELLINGEPILYAQDAEH